MVLKDKNTETYMDKVHSTSSQIIGTWSLQEIYYKNNIGEKINLYGPEPKGILMYDRHGYMNAQLGFSNRGMLKTSEPNNEEVKIASFDSYLSYYGKYFEKEPGTIIHQVEGCTEPSWEGEEETRFVNVNDDILYITTPEQIIDNTKTKIEVYWKRIF